MLFQNTKEKNKILENEIYLLNKKINEQKNTHILEKKIAKEQKKMYLEEITNENIEIQLRIVTIDHLKSIIRLDQR